MKQGKENFEIAKDKDDNKRNYILQKDNITRRGFYLIVAILIFLIIAVAAISNNLG